MGLGKQEVTTWKNLLTWVGQIANIGPIGAAFGLLELVQLAAFSSQGGGCHSLSVS